MRRLLRVLLPVIVLVPTITLAVPASATPPSMPTCAGAYDFAVSAPMGAPADPNITTSFQMTRWTGLSGTCGLGVWPPSQFGGTLTGNCGSATGVGYLPNGDVFDIFWTDTTLTIRGWWLDSSGVFAITAPMDCTGTTFDAVGVVGSAATLDDACVGFGVTLLSSPFVAARTVSANFYIGLQTGLCTSLSSFQAGGTVTGSCEFATGSGISYSNGAPFDLLWVENHLILIGSVVGVVNVAPDTLGGESCVSGADRFLANGTTVTFG